MLPGVLPGISDAALSPHVSSTSPNHVNTKWRTCRWRLILLSPFLVASLRRHFCESEDI